MLSRAVNQAVGLRLGTRVGAALLRGPSPLLSAAASLAPATQPQSRTSATAMGHGTMFKFERFFAMGMLPLFPLSYFVHGGVMDLALAVAISLHTHWGVHTVITDYARPLVLGEGLSNLCAKLTYVLSIALFVGLLNFNYNDVGITKGMQLLWSL